MENTVYMDCLAYVGDNDSLLVNHKHLIHKSQFYSYYSYGCLHYELYINRNDPRVKGDECTIQLAPSEDGAPGEEIIVFLVRGRQFRAPRR